MERKKNNFGLTEFLKEINLGKRAFSTDPSPQTRHAFIAMTFTCITSGKDVCYHLMMCTFFKNQIVNLNTFPAKPQTKFY